MGVEKHAPRGLPEGGHGGGQFDGGGADHDVVEVVPLQAGLCDHGGCYQGGYDAACAVEGVHYS